MIPTIDVRLDEFRAAARRWSDLSGRTIKEVVLTSAKMTVSNPRQGSGLMQITPPCSAGVTGIDGKRQGERAIERDLAKLFVPVRSKGIGPRAERRFRIEIEHRVRFAQKRPGRPLRLDRASPFFVDASDLRVYERELKKRVGFLASGWVASARQLGASVPAWIARHGPGRGTVRLQFSSPRYGVEMTCFAPANSPWQELQRRVPYALRYATNNLNRQSVYLIKRDAAACGFAVSG